MRLWYSKPITAAREGVFGKKHMLQQIEALEKRLRPDDPSKTRLPIPQNPITSALEMMRQKTKAELQTEHDRLANELYTSLVKFHSLLSNSEVGGKIDLGTNPKKIDWRNMSHAQAQCFKPEFTFQPEEITGFYISTSDNRLIMCIELSLERQSEAWSYIVASVMARSEYKAGCIEVDCVAGNGQITSAREAMKIMREGLRGATTSTDAQDLRNLVYSSNSLKEGQMLLEFAVGTLEKQLAPKPAGKK